MTAIPKDRDLIPTKTAAEILGMSPQGVRDLAHKGDLKPDGLYKIGSRETYFFERSTVEAYKLVREERLAAMQASIRREQGPKKPRVRGSAQAMLSILKGHADPATGFVDGDATDLCIGNPAPKNAWDDIEALRAAGFLEWGLDNWDRLTIQLTEGTKR